MNNYKNYTHEASTKNLEMLHSLCSELTPIGYHIEYIFNSVQDICSNICIKEYSHYEDNEIVAKTIQSVLARLDIKTEINFDGCYEIKYIEDDSNNFNFTNFMASHNARMSELDKEIDKVLNKNESKYTISNTADLLKECHDILDSILIDGFTFN